MASIKLHVFRGTDNGSDSCDYRGDKFIGHEQGDEHRTVLEIDPADELIVKDTLELGPDLNQLFSRLTASEPAELGVVATALGLAGSGPVGLRIGVWDE